MWPYPWETGDLVTFTEEIVNGKLHFCAVIALTIYNKTWRILFAYRPPKQSSDTSSKKFQTAFIKS